MAKQYKQYDKIFKENFEETILPLARKILGLPIDQLEEIPDELHLTLERKPDLLKKVILKDGPDYILHIEVQTKPEKGMAMRMHLYYVLLQHTYQLPVKQYVFYIGSETLSPTNMPTFIKEEKLTFSYDLLHLQSFPYHTFLVSDKPEEVILAILGDFGKQKKQNVIDDILTKLQKLEAKGKRIEKYLRQLEVLSKLRNLQKEIIKSLEQMAIVYELETDIRYQQGLKEGEKRGEKIGVRKGEKIGKKRGEKIGEKRGKAKQLHAVVISMLQSDLYKNGTITITQVAQLTGTTEKYVKQVFNELKK